MREKTKGDQEMSNDNDYVFENGDVFKRKCSSCDSLNKRIKELEADAVIFESKIIDLEEKLKPLVDGIKRNEVYFR